MSRRKGANGEREFRDLLRSHGFTCERDGSERGDLIHNVAGVHFEVKRCEKLEVTSWLRQAIADAAKKGLHAVVAFRRSRERWWVIVQASEYLRLKRIERLAEQQTEAWTRINPPEALPIPIQEMRDALKKAA
jgi:Holliday junction resolvase